MRTEVRNRPLKEATIFCESFMKRMNNDSQSDSWTWEERKRIENEIRADISSEFDELANKIRRFEKSSNTRTESTNDSAQNVSFPSETNRNSQVHDTPKDCLEEINESVFSCMFDDSNESAQSDSDSVFHAELINFSCDTQEEDGHENDLCLMFEESYDKCVNVGDLSRMVIDSNEVCTNVESPVENVHTGECLDVGVEVSLGVFECASEDLKLDGCLGNFAVEAQELLLVE